MLVRELMTYEPVTVADDVVMVLARADEDLAREVDTMLERSGWATGWPR